MARAVPPSSAAAASMLTFGASARDAHSSRPEFLSPDTVARALARASSFHF